MTGKEYADLIAAYLVHNYARRGLTVYREVSLGKSVIGKNRKVDILAVERTTNKALGIECKYQETSGTADEKIPYTLDDLEAMHVPAFVCYAGEGFSVGVIHMLESHKLAAYCKPALDLVPSKDTVELDHIIAMVFGFWDAVLARKQPFTLESWRRTSPPRSTPLFDSVTASTDDVRSGGSAPETPPVISSTDLRAPDEAEPPGPDGSR